MNTSPCPCQRSLQGSEARKMRAVLAPAGLMGREKDVGCFEAPASGNPSMRPQQPVPRKTKLSSRPLESITTIKLLLQEVGGYKGGSVDTSRPEGLPLGQLLRRINWNPEDEAIFPLSVV
jgi:hypothetical protein